MEYVQDYIDGADSCHYEEEWNDCTGEGHWCNFRIVIMGETVEGDCEEITAQFGIPIDEDDHHDYDDYMNCQW